MYIWGFIWAAPGSFGFHLKWKSPAGPKVWKLVHWCIRVPQKQRDPKIQKLACPRINSSNSVSGEAGQPRDPRDRRRPSTLGSEPARQRNAKRGLKSLEKIQERKKKRSIRRNINRREWRKIKGNLGRKAQEPNDQRENTKPKELRKKQPGKANV